jgi:translation initiation factor IF-3
VFYFTGRGIFCLDFLLKLFIGCCLQTRGGVVENKKIRINQFIRVPDVRLIGHDGTMMGIVKTVEALSKAQALDLDLVEISPQANPPVCKIISFSKFKYEMQKKGKETKKKQKVSQLKEVRIRPRIGEHDLGVKIKHIKSFIEDGNKVQITAMFSGREMQHKDLGIKVMDKIKESLSDIDETEGKPSSMGTRMFLILVPKKKMK